MYMTYSDQIPGPRGYPLLGVLPKFWRDPLGFLSDTVREYGDLVCLRRNRLYLVNHPDHVQHVLRDKRDNYCKNSRRIPAKNEAAPRHQPSNGAGENERRRTLGWKSVALSEGEEWRRQRAMVQPAFSSNHFAPLVNSVTEETKALLVRWKTLADTGHPVDIEREMLGLILSVLVKSLFRDSLDSPEKIETIAKAVRDTHEFFDSRVGSLISIPESIPTPANRRFQSAFKTLTNFIDSAVEERRKNGHCGNDLLGLLLSARDSKSGDGLSPKQVQDELLMLSILGHKTTATALTWTFFLLSQSAAAESRLHHEVVSVLGDRDAAIEDLSKLIYTRQVVDEALRIYPPTWIIGRVAVEDDVIAGYQLPAGATVLLSPYLLHRHTAYWRTPEVFDPDRFAPGTSSGGRRPAYLPFGDGERICMAGNFALIQLSLVLAEVMRSFHLELSAGSPVQPQPRAVLRPRSGLNMLLQSRVHTNARSSR
jgi:cytochrome P450